MGLIEWFKRWQLKRYCKSLLPENCYHGIGYETCAVGASQYICSKCCALINNTPFGQRIVMEDARLRFPTAKNLNVKRWIMEEMCSGVKK